MVYCIFEESLRNVTMPDEVFGRMCIWDVIDITGEMEMRV